MPVERVHPEVTELPPSSVPVTASRPHATRVTSRTARTAWFLLLAACHAVVPARAQGPVAPVPERDHLEAWVRDLTSPELEGRRGEGGRKTAALLIEEFRRLGLEPAFAGQFVQVVPATALTRSPGRNVAGILRGRDPTRRDEWILVSAHYDHLGVRDGVVYPGADDNASGVAMMLEVARSMAGNPERPPRSVMFIGFDQEEFGLYGSRFFAAHPPVAIDKIALFITADMISRALGGVCREHVFVFGSEHAPGLRPWVEGASRGRKLSVGLLGADIMVLDRSDYGPFRARRVPFLFFTTGENPHYHSPRDTPESIDYAKLTDISQVIHRVAASAATAQVVPRWNDVPDNPLTEALALRDVIRRLYENRASLKVGAAQVYLMRTSLNTLDGIIGRGMMSPSERAGVIQAARLLLLTTF